MNEISVRECVSTGWRIFKSRPWFFVGAELLVVVVGVIADLPQTLARHSYAGNLSIGFVAFLISTALGFLISMGKTAFYLRAHDAPESVEMSDLWHPRLYWKYAVASVLTGAATIIGLILLIVPGIIIGIALGFTSYLIIEKELSPMDAMRESMALTKGHRKDLFVLGAALLGINIIGFCALFIGLLVSLPVSILAVIHAYRVLSGPEVVSVDGMTAGGDLGT